MGRFYYKLEKNEYSTIFMVFYNGQLIKLVYCLHVFLYIFMII